ncbi:MAG: DUF5958 family protein [Polyangiaceae bacterium]
MNEPVELVLLNQLAQGIRPMEAGLGWFSNLTETRRREVLQSLAAIILQAHPGAADVQEAIARSKLKPSHTPAVLLGKGELGAQAAKIVSLPSSEQQKAFVLLVALLSVADGRRRRTECALGCTHWWHQDLSGADIPGEMHIK